LSFIRITSYKNLYNKKPIFLKIDFYFKIVKNLKPFEGQGPLVSHSYKMRFAGSRHFVLCSQRLEQTKGLTLSTNLKIMLDSMPSLPNLKAF